MSQQSPPPGRDHSETIAAAGNVLSAVTHGFPPAHDSCTRLCHAALRGRNPPTHSNVTRRLDATGGGQHSRTHHQGRNPKTGSTAVPSPSAAPSATYNGGIVTCVCWTPHKQRPTFKNPPPELQSDAALNHRPVAVCCAECDLQWWHGNLCRLDAAQAAANIQEPITKAAIRRRAQPPSRRPRLRQVRPTVVASLPV